MKVSVALCVLALVALSAGKPQTRCNKSIKVKEHSRPSPPRNCIAKQFGERNETSLFVKCWAGYAGGLNQHFTLDVLGENGRVLGNTTADILEEVRFFISWSAVENLEEDEDLVVTARNSKGASDPVSVKDLVIRDAEKRPARPSSPQNCTKEFVHYHSNPPSYPDLTIKCAAGYDGGLNQHFTLDVLGPNGRVLGNTTANFVDQTVWFNISWSAVKNLEEDEDLVVTARNSKGAANPVSLKDLIFGNALARLFFRPCSVGYYLYKADCGLATPEPTCHDPNPVPWGTNICDFSGCDYSSCYCNPPTLKDSVSGKCVQPEECP